MTGCLGGVSVEEKENSATIDNSNYERVVVVDYGSEQNLNYNDELSESLVEENSSSNQQAEDTASRGNGSSGSNGAVVTDESPQTENGNENGSNEYCGVIFKTFIRNNYYLNVSSSSYILSLPSNLEYGLESNLNFPFDSANVCLNGTLSFTRYSYSNGISLISTQKSTINVTGFSSSLNVSTEHPWRETPRLYYSKEFCGSVTLESNNHTGVNIYKLYTHEGQNFDLKFSTKLGDTVNETESFIYDNEEILDANIDISNGNYCLYSNSAPAREELWTYRKILRVQSISGPWN